MSERPMDQIPRPRARRVALALFAVGVGALAVAYVGTADRARSLQETRAWTEAEAVPTVAVVHARRGPGEQNLTLPGNVRAFYESALFARASGYVTAWNKDIGDHVRKGDVLAEISAPDLDQQLAEAKANLVQLQAAVLQAQANADLGDATNKRTSHLVAQGWTSAEQGDTDRFNAASRQAALAVAKANIVAQQAAVGRLEELSRFKKIVAPFDGVVTARAVDVGNLVNAGGTTGRALFDVADLHRMRIYVDVPQAYLGEMKPGLKATLTVPGQDRTFAAEVVSTANAVAEGSRTGLVQLQADNPDGKLWPGAFADITFHVPSDAGVLEIPATALVFGRHGMEVALVDADHRVQLKPVELGRNLGGDVEITRGVTLADRLVDNAPESMSSGDTVKILGEGDQARVAQRELPSAP